ncbi:MAG: ParB/RepB/Spo0J family partition protein [Anaerolineae bacterium]|nr:ParB/RepB/Spo0J family partition protein [Anaerolineae bacterium]
MAKRRGKRGSALDTLFSGTVDPYAKLNEPDAAAPVGSALAELDVMTILPDPEQPRHFLPDDLYERLRTGTSNAVEVLQAWMTRATRLGSPPAMQQEITALEQLAQTIEWHGLINPITVRPVTDDNVPTTVAYLIRTGERRWWAHVLLTSQQKRIQDKQSPEVIKAIIDTDVTLLRAEQLVENMARSDLSVIEKAQGIELLHTELSEARGRKVKWEEVDQLLGISRNYRWRLRKVLTLSDEAVQLIIENNLQEKPLRPVVDKLADRPDLQLAAIRQLIMWQEAEETGGHDRLSSYVEQLLRQERVGQGRAKSANQKVSLSAWSKKFGRNVAKTLQLFDDLNEEALGGVAAIVANDDAAAADLALLRDKINAILTESSRLE